MLWYDMIQYDTWKQPNVTGTLFSQHSITFCWPVTWWNTCSPRKGVKRTKWSQFSEPGEIWTGNEQKKNLISDKKQRMIVILSPYIRKSLSVYVDKITNNKVRFSKSNTSIRYGKYAHANCNIEKNSEWTQDRNDDNSNLSGSSGGSSNSRTISGKNKTKKHQQQKHQWWWRRMTTTKTATKFQLGKH